MCWWSYNKENTKFKIADRNIIVYKVLVNNTFAPIRKVCYQLNRKNDNVPIKIIACKHFYGGDTFYNIIEGYHSFSSISSLCSIISIADIRRQVKYDSFFEDENKCNIHFAYIPKGTIYYENEFREIVSENIVVTDKIYSEHYWFGLWKNLITRIKLKIHLIGC